MAVDIVQVKTAIRNDELMVTFHNGNILLKNLRSGEAVKIGELPKEFNPYYEEDEDGDT